MGTGSTLAAATLGRSGRAREDATRERLTRTSRRVARSTTSSTWCAAVAAYRWPSSRTLDAAWGIASSAATLALAGPGRADRAQRTPWVVLAFAAKVDADAGAALLLTAEQASRHRGFCGQHCLIAFGFNVVAVQQV